MARGSRSKFEPVIGEIPSASRRPSTGTIPEKKKWRFSFEYWRQIEYFGLGTCQKSWHASFVARLQSLSAEFIDDYLKSQSKLDAIHYHEIIWDAKNIPIKKSDINWIGEFADNEDFQLVQFSISAAVGRVIGFFDAQSVFNIVLLDPMHNIHPVKRLDYAVTATYAAQSEYMGLVTRYKQAINKSPYLNSEQKAEMTNEAIAGYQSHVGSCLIIAISNERRETLIRMASDGLLGNLGEALEETIKNLDPY